MMLMISTVEMVNWKTTSARRMSRPFPEAAKRLHTQKVKVTGTPVRAQFQPEDAGECRAALGLDPDRPVLLVTGGSQGASGLNDLVIAALPFLAQLAPQLQLFHLTGPGDAEKVTRACAEHKIKAVVRPFFAAMNVALGAASAAISRAGASSLAELAALRVPAILVPYPAATDNHQYYNALAFEKTGAAWLMPQRETKPELLAVKLAELAGNEATREKMRAALATWDAPQAAEQIAESIMQVISARRKAASPAAVTAQPNLKNRQTAIS